MFFVRTASRSDLEKVRALLAASFHATYDDLYGPKKVQELIDAWHGAATLEKHLEAKGAEFLVADDGKRIGGMAYARRKDDRPETVVLHQLYVHPDCHRQGIGRDIFAELETCFPGVDLMELEVEPRNTKAVAFYSAHGFVPVEEVEIESGPAKGLKALIMHKPLETF
ncbi:MAG: GNAT family N-acetyltransferase [Shinella sp.]|nr:MAG: GNAT family N-acetyltransferase [Shinella sp.]